MVNENLDQFQYIDGFLQGNSLQSVENKSMFGEKELDDALK